MNQPPVAIGNQALMLPTGFNKTRVEVGGRNFAEGVGGAVDPVCPFGEIITWTEGEVTKTGIRGGSVQAGPTTVQLDPYEINLNTGTDTLVWIEVDVSPNEADGVLLPGINAASIGTWSTGGAYPPQVMPTISGGIPVDGMAVLPLGRLVVDVTDGTPGVVTFAPNSCGSFIVQHCPGSLTHSRQ